MPQMVTITIPIPLIQSQLVQRSTAKNTLLVEMLPFGHPMTPNLDPVQTGLPVPRILDV